MSGGGEAALAVAVGAIIERERKRSGVTQTDLAKAIGVQSNAIWGWETGARLPRMNHLFDLLWELDVPQSVFLEILAADAKTRERAA
ncbi:helix-turn-helix domain-containing protein [Gluconacetobacter diazotrophicus]|uniref:HTH cro/C1-type domain-containing protein n=1 Tax=Gluconacetobacter diazotrophicus (strain ATCC 49037 / DSM 5601 / CCUG 37298 / CIP 103539 / LMG 7603 / PAl5) TaxID=272568 RepID=A9HP51_GLUDA|nr:helix-turn-helix transcriptional regulator [Gluconacetobacter diazotrophicus]CAP56545.1 hypothetical protein GDI2602 [Gluconacetobacter diazotrophicus PA1 5]